MAATEIMSLRLPPDLKRYVEQDARANGKSQNEVVIEAIVARKERMDAEDAQTDR